MMLALELRQLTPVFIAGAPKPQHPWQYAERGQGTGFCAFLGTLAIPHGLRSEKSERSHDFRVLSSQTSNLSS